MVLLALKFNEVLQERVIEDLILLARILLLDTILQDLGQILCAHEAVVVLVKVQECLPNVVVIALQLLLQIMF